MERRAAVNPKLLLDESPLLVLPSLAARIGLNEAIVLQQMHYWLRSSRHEHDGQPWIYNTVESWTRQFPFWSEATVWRTLKRLEALGLILAVDRGSPMHSQMWYTVVYEAVVALEDEGMPPALKTAALAVVPVAVPEAAQQAAAEETAALKTATPEPASLPADPAPFQNEISTFQNEISAFQDETPPFQNETPPFQNEIPAFQNEMRIIRNRDYPEITQRDPEREGAPAIVQAPPAPSPAPARPTGRCYPLPPTRGRVTADFYDPRKLVGGMIPAGQGTTPVEIHREFFAWSEPRQALSTFNCRVISDEVTDLERWRAACQAWAGAGYTGANRTGLMDWYGGRHAHKRKESSHARRESKPAEGWTPDQVAACRWRGSADEWDEIIATLTGAGAEPGAGRGRGVAPGL